MPFICSIAQLERRIPRAESPGYRASMPEISSSPPGSIYFSTPLRLGRIRRFIPIPVCSPLIPQN